MLIRRVLLAGTCTVALGIGAVGLYGGDIVAPSLEAQRCADGSCLPRRLTNGYYPTTWRRWPIEPPARAKPGVREGIPAPSMELPSPQMETYLPEGALIAPPSLPDDGADGDFRSPPRDPGSVVPPPQPRTPRDEPRPDLPPELRSGQLRSPKDMPTQKHLTTITRSNINRPAAVFESFGSETSPWPAHAAEGREISSVPAALPNDEGQAQPLPPPAVETPSIKPKMRSAPHSAPQPALNTSAWQPAASKRFEEEEAIAPTDRPALERSSSALNAPAAIYARSLAGGARQPASRPDLSISAPDSAVALAVRTVSEPIWNPSSPHHNPLRSGSAVRRVAFEYSGVAVSDEPAAAVRAAATTPAGEALLIPSNPLRR